jgi:hypothetical protein
LKKFAKARNNLTLFTPATPAGYIFGSFLSMVCGTSAALASYEHSVVLAAGQVHETCNELPAGDVLSYQYTGSSVSLFNIHYHDGKNIIYPVPDELAFRRNSSLTTGSAQNYCLMWKNIRSTPVTIWYRIDLPVVGSAAK